MKIADARPILLCVMTLLASSACSGQPSEQAVRAAAEAKLKQHCDERPEKCREVKYVSASHSKGYWLVEYRSDSHHLAIIVHRDLSAEVSSLAESR